MSDRTFERAVSDWLEDGSDRTPRHAIDAVLLAVKATPQERNLRAVTSSSLWNAPLRVPVAGLAAIVVVGAMLFQLAPRGVGPQPPPTPSPAASDLTTLSPTTVEPGGWTPFVSDRLGVALKFPPGWTVVAATDPWIWQEADPGPAIAATDRAVGPRNEGLVVASQRIPDGMDENAWWADYLSGNTTSMPPGCFPATRAEYQALTVAGHAGYLHGGLPACNFTEVVVVVDGRAYQLTGYARVDVPLGGVFDRGVFDAWLSTVTFDAAAADDSPAAASPGAS